jgi:hypothetical protein
MEPFRSVPSGSQTEHILELAVDLCAAMPVDCSNNRVIMLNFWALACSSFPLSSSVPPAVVVILGAPRHGLPG